MHRSTPEWFPDSFSLHIPWLRYVHVFRPNITEPDIDMKGEFAMSDSGKKDKGNKEQKKKPKLNLKEKRKQKKEKKQKPAFMPGG